MITVPPLRAVSRAAFVARVRSYVDTPYVHQGRVPGPHGGMDCPAPMICAARALGLKPPEFDITDYSSQPDGYSLRAACDAHLEPIAFVAAQPADVLLCRWRQGPPQHLLALVERKPDGRLYAVQAVGPPVGPEDRARCRVRVTRVEFDARWFGLVQAYRIPGVVDDAVPPLEALACE